MLGSSGCNAICSLFGNEEQLQFSLLACTVRFIVLFLPFGSSVVALAFVLLACGSIFASFRRGCCCCCFGRLCFDCSCATVIKECTRTILAAHWLGISCIVLVFLVIFVEVLSIALGRH